MRIQLSDHFSYGKLLRFTFPSIAMMIFMSIYGVVDGFFVSNFVGKTPFAAVNLIYPFLMITDTVGLMFGTGGTAIVSRAFGQKDPVRANQHFSLFVYVSFGLGVLFAVLSIVYIRPISILLGAQGELLENCVVYARIILAALPFCVLQMLFQSFFVAAEKIPVLILQPLCVPRPFGLGTFLLGFVDKTGCQKLWKVQKLQKLPGLSLTTVTICNKIVLSTIGNVSNFHAAFPAFAESIHQFEKLEENT